LDLGGGIGTTDIPSFADPDFPVPDYGRPIDFRTFGISDWDSVEHGAKFENTFPVLETCRVENSRIEPDGRCQFTMAPTDNVRIDFWINTERGYTVERAEMRTFDRATNERSGVMVLADTTWAERAGVWVPVEIRLERNFNGTETYVAKLDWEDVNRDLTDGLFEPSGLGLDPEGIIVDGRLGDKPVVVGKIKDDGRPPAPIPPVVRAGRRWVWILIGIPVPVALVFLFLILSRRRRPS
jgi:hypothetical protein